MTLREFREVWKNRTLCDVTAMAYGRESGEYYSFRNTVYRKNIKDDSAFPDFLLDEEVESVYINEYEGNPLLLIDTKELVDEV